MALDRALCHGPHGPGFWRTLPDKSHNSHGWHFRWRNGRIEVGFHLWCHHSHLGDRWVLQPFGRYDRKHRLNRTRRSTREASDV